MHWQVGSLPLVPPGKSLKTRIPQLYGAEYRYGIYYLNDLLTSKLFLFEPYEIIPFQLVRNGPMLAISCDLAYISTEDLGKSAAN